MASARVSSLESAIKNGSSIRYSTLNPVDLLTLEAKFRFASRENLIALSDRIHKTAVIAPVFN